MAFLALGSTECNREKKMLEQVATKVSEYSKRYGIDFAYIIRNEFWVYLRQGVLLIVGLATVVAFARLAPKEIYGQYNFIFAILAIVALVSIPGLDNAVLRSVARGNDGNYTEAVKTKFLWSLLGIPVLLGTGAYYYHYGTPIIGICLMISSVFFPFIYAPEIWKGFVQGKRRFDLMAKYGSMQSTVNAAAIIAILFLNPTHLVLIVVAHLAVTACLTCFFYLRSQRYIENKVEDNECVRYGYFLTTANIVTTLVQNIDKILIGILLGAPQLAIYSIALVVPREIRVLLKPAWTPFVPKFSQDWVKMTYIQEKARRFILPLALATLGGSLLYWFFIDDIMLLFFSSKYMESIIYSRILLLSILASIPTVFLGYFTIAKKNTKAIVLGLYVSPILTLLITCSFIYLWGIMGAVWALNLGASIQVLLFGVGMRGEKTPLGQQFQSS
ncbi:hypothetical protein ES707_05177 [subsurface metagenome]